MRRILVSSAKPSSDARLVVGLNEADVLRASTENLTAYLQLGFFGLLVLLIAWFGGERLIVEADPLTGADRRRASVAAISMCVRPSQAWAKEFEPLAAALNEMAGKLCRARTRAARRQPSPRRARLDRFRSPGLANRRGFDARLVGRLAQRPASCISRSRC